MIERSLTIGIPTFNRIKAITSCMEFLENKNLPEGIEILVIDNNSPDGTFEFLSKRFTGENVRILKNKENLGFAGNTLQLIKECRTNYLLWNPDEDKPIIENLNFLLDFISKESPKLVCPQYFLDGKLYRGKRTIQTIKPKDTWDAAPHGPGLVYHVPSTKEILSSFEEIKNKYPRAYEYYPQIFLLSELLIQGKCLYWDKPINKQDIFLEATHAKDEFGSAYYGLSMRWILHKEFTDYFYSLIRKNKGSKIARNLYSMQTDRLFKVIRQAIETERPDLLLGFDKGLLKRIYRLCYALLRDLLRHPVDTSYKILILVGIKKSK